MEYRDIKCRNYRMNAAQDQLRALNRGYFKEPRPLGSYNGQATILLSTSFDSDGNLASKGDPVLRKVRDAEPYQVAHQMMGVEYYLRELLRGKAVELFDHVLDLNRASTAPVMVTVAHQFRRAAESLDRDNDWARAINLVVNYLDKVASVPDLPNLESAWSFIHQDNTPQHLAAALACLLDLNTLALHRIGSVSMVSAKVKYVQPIKIDWNLPWESCVAFMDKGIGRRGWAQNGTYHTTPVTLHDWKSLQQLAEDDEADLALEILSGIGKGPDSS